MSHPHTHPKRDCARASEKLHINTKKPTHENPCARTFAARCSQPLSTNQTPHPTTKTRGDNQTNPRHGDRTTSGFPQSGRRSDGPVASKPNSVSDDSIAAPRPLTRTSRGPACLLCTRPAPTTGHSPSTDSPTVTVIRAMRAGRGLVVLLRKEVIQPHLPVRLPCYDFVPVAAPALGRCLLTVSPRTSSIDNSHDVTGGVYKARVRIHRAMADTRLLATPPSWGRVAAPNLH